MSNYIHALKETISKNLPITEQKIIPGFTHQFMLSEESVLPQWSKKVKLEGVVTGLAELNWLLDEKADVEVLHSAGCHHRDGFIEYEEVSYAQTLDEDQRINIIAERFREEGVAIESIDDLREAFVNNGMMAKYLTLEACIREFGVESEQKVVLIHRGQTGPNHGCAFSYPGDNGMVLFQHPNLIPLADNNDIENLKEGRLKYTPKQVMMTFIKTLIPMNERLEYFFNDFEPEDENAMDVVKALVEGKEYADIPNINGFFDLTMYESIGREEAIRLIFNVVDCPEYYLSAKLHMTTLFPMTEFAHEVVPYAIYAQFIANRMGALNHSFTLSVDGLVVDEEETNLIDQLISEFDFNIPTATMSIDKDIKLGSHRLTIDDLKLNDYFGN